MIIRVHRHERDFTIIGNTALRHPALTFRARGVMAYLLSLPPDSRIDSTDLGEHSPREGRRAILAALKELEAAGYLTRQRIQGEKGRWRTETVLYEEPPVVATEVRLPHAGKPTVGEPAVGASHAKEKNSEKDSLAAVAAEKRQDLLAEELARVCRISFDGMTKSGRGSFNRALSDLRSVGATPEQIRFRAKAYKSRYPEAALTPPALAKHWPSLGVTVVGVVTRRAHDHVWVPHFARADLEVCVCGERRTRGDGEP